MKRFLTTYLLPGISIVSMLSGVEDACTNLYWTLALVVIAITLIILGICFFRKSDIPRHVPGILTTFGVILLCTIGWESYSLNKQQDRSVIWQEYVQKNAESHSVLTDLQKEATIDKDARAQFKLALCYFNGIDGYERDYVLAREFAQKSADQGYSKANELLALIYLNGYGCTIDIDHAYSNILLSLKGGNEQSVSLLSLVDSTLLHISTQDRKVLEQCNENASYLDSLVNLLASSMNNIFKSKEIIASNRIRCEELSKQGYLRATEILYFGAFGEDEMKSELKEYTRILVNADQIPDLPLMRDVFLYNYLSTEEKNLNDCDNLLNTSLKYQNFQGLSFNKSFDKQYFSDITYRYKYDMAQYERSKYLLRNRDNLHRMMFLIAEENVDTIYTYAKKSLQECAKEIEKEMLSKPYHFR